MKKIVEQPAKKKEEREVPKVSQHHGTCDSCGTRYVLVIHFGYNTQPKRDYRMCRECYGKVVFGDAEMWGER